MEPKHKPTEVDLASRIVDYFEHEHWEVFQEVQLHQSGPRADIVVRQGRIVGVVECKQSLGLPVLEQAFEWLGYAHLVWVATWQRSGQRSRLINRILGDHGIGYLWLSQNHWEDGHPSEKPSPRLLRLPPNLELLTQKLTSERRHVGTAGSARGGHWTPFKQTCWALKEIAEEHPGITLKEALGKFKSHYANTRSAMCNLPEWIEKGKVPGVTLDRTDGKLRLVLATPKPDLASE